MPEAFNLFQVTFDWSFNFGNLLTGLVLLLGFLRAHQQNISRLDKIETKLEMIYDWWVEQTKPGPNGPIRK